MFALFALLLVPNSITVGSTSEVSQRKADLEGDLLDTCNTLKLEAQEIRREAYTVINKADAIRDQAYRVQDEALEIKDEALDVKEKTMEAKSELESTLIETLLLVRSQSTVTNLYIQEIRSSISSMERKMEGLEEKMEGLEEKMEAKIGELEKKTEELEDHSTTVKNMVSEQAAVSLQISDHVTETLSSTKTVRKRQEVQMSEVRLISLYKMTGTNNHLNNHDSDLAVDGMVTFGQHHWGDTATYTHSANANPGNKLWIELGGLFKIHKVKIWNLRHCCQERIIGTNVHADKRLIGTVIEALGSYDFTTDELVYGSKVTLEQPLGQSLHVLEVQVWGKGPYSEDDMF